MKSVVSLGIVLPDILRRIQILQESREEVEFLLTNSFLVSKGVYPFFIIPLLQQQVAIL